MAILVDEGTKVVVAGITGSEGTFHALRNRSYGTQVVAGVTPARAGRTSRASRCSTPWPTPSRRPARTPRWSSCRPGSPRRRSTRPRTRRRADRVHHRGHPGPGHGAGRRLAPGTGAALVEPNCPGVISPGRSNVGIIPGEICTPGRVGLVSRSGTLTYQIVHELTQRGIGQSTCVGMGGDPVHGIGFIESLERFEADPTPTSS